MRIFILPGYVIIGSLQGLAYLVADEALQPTPTTAMGALIFVTVALITLMAWTVKRQFDRNDKQGEQIQAMLLVQQDLTAAVKANQETLIRQGSLLEKQGVALDGLTKTSLDLHGIQQEVLDDLIAKRRERGRQPTTK